MKTPQVAALRIQRSLLAGETGIDAVLGDTGSLMSELVGARVAFGIPAATGQRALARLAAAQSKLVEARLDFIRAHEDLRGIATTMDMPNDCPDVAFTVAEDERLAS